MIKDKLDSNYTQNTQDNVESDKINLKNTHILRKDKRLPFNRNIHVSEQRLMRVLQGNEKNEENLNHPTKMINLKNDLNESKRLNQNYGEKYNKFNDNSNGATPFTPIINKNYIQNVNESNEEISSRNIVLNKNNYKYNNTGNIFNYKKFSNIMQNTVQDPQGIKDLKSRNLNENANSTSALHHKNYSEINKSVSVPESSSISSENDSIKTSSVQNLLTMSQIINHKQINGDSSDSKIVLKNLVTSEKAKYPSYLNTLLLSNKEKTENIHHDQERNININRATSKMIPMNYFQDSRLNSMNYPNSNSLNEQSRNYSTPCNKQTFPQFNPYYIPYTQTPTQNNFYINANITNLNFNNYSNNCPEDLDDSQRKYQFDSSTNQYNPSRHLRKYSNNNPNQNNRRRNDRYGSNTNNYKDNNEFQKGYNNNFNNNYQDYNSNRGGIYNNRADNKFRYKNQDNYTYNNNYINSSNKQGNNFGRNANFFKTDLNRVSYPESMYNNQGYYFNKGGNESNIRKNMSYQNVHSNSSNNFEILNINVKLNKDTKSISLNKCDDFYKKAREFCIENNLPDKVIVPMSIKLHYAVNSINKILNTNLTELDKDYLNSLNSLYDQSINQENFTSKEEHLKQDSDSSTLSSISNIEEELCLDFQEEKIKLNRTL